MESVYFQNYKIVPRGLLINTITFLGKLKKYGIFLDIVSAECQ